MNTPKPPSISAQRRPRTSRALKSHQIWPKALRPLIRARDQIAKLAQSDPAFPEIQRQLDAMVSVLFGLQKRRALAEAQAKDRGVVLWTVFHPRGRTIFDLQRIVTRTPNTLAVKNEYVTIPDAAPKVREESDVWVDLEKELARDGFDLAKFREHARCVDESYRKFLANGGPERKEPA